MGWTSVLYTSFEDIKYDNHILKGMEMAQNAKELKNNFWMFNFMTVKKTNSPELSDMAQIYDPRG